MVNSRSASKCTPTQLPQFVADSPLEGSGFEISVPRYPRWSHFRLDAFRRAKSAAGLLFEVGSDRPLSATISYRSRSSHRVQLRVWPRTGVLHRYGGTEPCLVCGIYNGSGQRAGDGASRRGTKPECL